MKKLLFLLLSFIMIQLQAQNADSIQLRKIFENAIICQQAQENLKYLCKETPGRLLGTENSLKAVNYMKAYAEDMEADTVFLQEFRTPAWIHESSNVQHLIAIESDAGAFRPLGLTFDAEQAFIDKAVEFKELLEPYGAEFLIKGYGGVDIRPLKDLGVPLAGLNTVRQRYYDYHHAKTDTFEEVNFREMQMGTTLLASFIFLADKYGDELQVPQKLNN